MKLSPLFGRKHRSTTEGSLYQSVRGISWIVELKNAEDIQYGWEDPTNQSWDTGIRIMRAVR